MRLSAFSYSAVSFLFRFPSFLSGSRRCLRLINIPRRTRPEGNVGESVLKAVVRKHSAKGTNGIEKDNDAIPEQKGSIIKGKYTCTMIG